MALLDVAPLETPVRQEQLQVPVPVCVLCDPYLVGVPVMTTVHLAYASASPEIRFVWAMFACAGAGACAGPCVFACIQLFAPGNSS